jgi:EmrB/QacA subfamily drug resistance transporter
MLQTITTPHAKRAMPVLCLASLGCALTVLDTNVVGIVLPAIARDLHASFASIEWVVSAYVLVFAALLLPAGVIADKHGRKRVFLAGITLFGLASLACGAAGSALTLILARVCQGMGAAFLIAPALAIIAHRFQTEHERAHAWSIWGSAMGLTMVLSPLIGGLISSSIGWRWAFYINVPICAALCMAVPKMIEDSRDPHPRQLDLPGMALFVLGILCVTSALIMGPMDGWNSSVVTVQWLGGACVFVLFVMAERRCPHPMLELGLFRRPTFVGAVVAMFAYASSAQVMASLLPLYLQGARGDTPLAAGVAMLPFALAMLFFPRVGRRLGKRLDGHHILTLGLLVVGLGNALMAYAAWSDSAASLIAAMAILGAGGGLLNGETQKAVMTSVPAHRSGMASGISTTSRFSGILIGFSGLGALLASSTRKIMATDGHIQALPGFRVSEAFVDQVVSGDFQPMQRAVDPSWMTQLLTRTHRDYGDAFASVFLLATFIAGVAAAIVFWTMRKKHDGQKSIHR